MVSVTHSLDNLSSRYFTIPPSHGVRKPAEDDDLTQSLTAHLRGDGLVDLSPRVAVADEFLELEPALGVSSTVFYEFSAKFVTPSAFDQGRSRHPASRGIGASAHVKAGFSCTTARTDAGSKLTRAEALGVAVVDEQWLQRFSGN